MRSRGLSRDESVAAQGKLSMTLMIGYGLAARDLWLTSGRVNPPAPLPIR